MWQLKGIKEYNAARKESITRENVSVEYGWVTSSSARRDWLFVQFNKDMDDQGRKLYECLNNLGALCQVPSLYEWLDKRCMVAVCAVCMTYRCPCSGLDFPDGMLRQSCHEDVVEKVRKQLHDGTFTGTKPKKGAYSSMFPERDDGHALASFILQQRGQPTVCGGWETKSARHLIDLVGLPRRSAEIY